MKTTLKGVKRTLMSIGLLGCTNCVSFDECTTSPDIVGAVDMTLYVNQGTDANGKTKWYQVGAAVARDIVVSGDPDLIELLNGHAFVLTDEKFPDVRLTLSFREPAQKKSAQ